MPSSESVIDPAMIRTYLETEYRVSGVIPITLKVGLICSGLTELHKSYGVTCSAFVTACNPFSQQLDNVENTKRHAALSRLLENRRLNFVEGIGKHPLNNWPGEPSYLVLGLGLDAAKDLGIRLEQNAIIWINANVIPQLILLR